MSNKQIDLLFNFWKQKKPSGSVIIRSKSNNHLIVEKAINQLLYRIIADHRNCSIENAQNIVNMGHADILYLRPEGANYKLEDIAPVFSFCEYRSIELPSKIVVLSNANKLSEIHFNKLLTTIESPPTPTLFLLGVAGEIKLLPTIESRCLKMSLPDVENSEEDLEYTKQAREILETLSKSSSVSEAIDLIANPTNDLILALIDVVLSYELEMRSSYHNKDELNQIIKSIKESQTYNNHSKIQLFKVLDYWHKNEYAL